MALVAAACCLQQLRCRHWQTEDMQYAAITLAIHRCSQAGTNSMAHSAGRQMSQTAPRSQHRAHKSADTPDDSPEPLAEPPYFFRSSSMSAIFVGVLPGSSLPSAAGRSSGWRGCRRRPTHPACVTSSVCCPLVLLSRSFTPAPVFRQPVAACKRCIREGSGAHDTRWSWLQGGSDAASVDVVQSQSMANALGMMAPSSAKTDTTHADPNCVLSPLSLL